MKANNKMMISKTRLLGLLVLVLLLTSTAHGAAPGITGPSFSLTAQAAYLSQPDGVAVYSWGYGCNGAPIGFAPLAIPTTRTFCNAMQVPGPTLIVHEGDDVVVALTNNLPPAAGNTSILFPGFQLSAFTDGTPGLLTQEAATGQTVTYRFHASSPGTRAYYSGTQSDLQVEMGLYGAIIVLPANPPGNCATGTSITNLYGQTDYGTVNGVTGFPEHDFRLSTAAYDHPGTCYDREYMFQFAEMDPRIHQQAQEQASSLTCTGCLNVATEPYRPTYFLINGRSMPDDMDPNYAQEYPHQPYNGNPHMHPGELTLIRVIGQGRWQHPFHEHGNHVRILARDGNLILSSGTVPYAGTTSVSGLAGRLEFTTDTTPGQAFDGIFYWTAKGLNWDAYGHNPKSTSDSNATLVCTPDGNGYNTVNPTIPAGYNVQAALNYYEWCQDHNKPVQVNPFGDVASGGPVTLPDPNIFTNGPWYGGSPYLGPDATLRATGCMATGALQSNAPNCGSTGSTPPSGTIANPPSSEAGFAFMWHSHNEREITTNNVFPGGMLMMMLVDSREFAIDESM